MGIFAGVTQELFFPLNAFVWIAVIAVSLASIPLPFVVISGIYPAVKRIDERLETLDGRVRRVEKILKRRFPTLPREPN